MITNKQKFGGFRFVALILGLSTAVPSLGQEFTERFADWPTDLKINGSALAGNVGPTSSAVIAVLNQPQWNSRNIALVGTEALASPWKESLSMNLTPNRSINLFVDPKQIPRDSIFLWISSSTDTQPLGNEWMHIQDSMKEHLANQGVVCAFGPMFPMLGRVFLDTENPTGGIKHEGANLMPDCLLIQRSAKESIWPVIKSSIAPSLRLVTLDVENECILELTGRKLQLHGEAKATCRLVSGPHHSEREQMILAKSPEQKLEDRLIDLTEWRRDAIERTLEPFPSKSVESPVVPNGSLIIVGGGGMPAGLMKRFVDAAGGPEKANLVYIPCSEEDDLSRDTSMLNNWQRMGVKTCCILHTKDRNKAHTEDSFYEPLRTATGIWFGGGRQWNLADSYHGTTTHKLMKDVLSRGGVVGGSSAGASIQAKYLARATPIGNFRIMAPGYERGGLGFIGGVAIDQHFTQRGRHADLRSLVQRYPQLLGIGIDEATALIVKQSHAEIVGKGEVYFYSQNYETKEFIEHRIIDGGQYDLKERTLIAQVLSADKS